MDRIINNTIGWTLIACGVLYALFGSVHSDAARFLASCIAIAGGLTAMDNDKTEDTHIEGNPVKESWNSSH